MAKSFVVLTGDKKLDAALQGLEPAMQKKAIRYATKQAAKLFKERLRPTIPKDTGAMADALQVRAVAKRIKRPTGAVKQATSKNGFNYTFQVTRVVAVEYGAKIEITRKSLAKQLAKRGHIEKAQKIASDRYFYPAIVELGGKERAAEMPFRRALRTQKQMTIGIFRAYLSQFIQQQTGRGVYD